MEALPQGGFGAEQKILTGTYRRYHQVPDSSPLCNLLLADVGDLVKVRNGQECRFWMVYKCLDSFTRITEGSILMKEKEAGYIEPIECEGATWSYLGLRTVC